MYKTDWILKPEMNEAEKMAADLGVSPVIARVMANRGITAAGDAQKFLFGTLDDLHDPYLMAGMTKAVERIETAISGGEHILIFGDYDVDGVLSVVSLFKALESLGADKVGYYIPNRIEEGYGLKERYVEVAQARKVDLIISVDCGIKAIEFIREARKLGIDIIVTDHHLPGPLLPEAMAILNPMLPDSEYPEKRLAGVGIVFKLIQALFQKRGGSFGLSHYLKIVSIGTIADVAELRGENRLFAKFGLRGLEDVSNPGLKMLLKACGLNRREISAGDVMFRIGPRINAPGRLGKADLAVELFLSKSAKRVEEIVSLLDSMNSERQSIEERIYNQAVAQVRDKDLNLRYKLLVLGCDEWHRGVIGIVASKIKDLYHRPVLLFAYQDGKAFGSGRSIRAFSLIDCLDQCQDHFISFGGHRLAVGCETEREKLASLKLALNRCAESRLDEDTLKKKIAIDTKMDFADINNSLIDDYLLLSPFGNGNPKPIFLTERARIISDPQKIQGRHSKIHVRQGGRIFEALAWRRGDWAEILHRGMDIDLVYTFHFSQFLGEDKLSLSVEDIRIL